MVTEYSEIIIKTGKACFKKSFELYVSREGQVAWSPYKPGHEPHINPQKEIQASRATDYDVGKMLAEMTQIELKNVIIPAFLMVRNNKDLVTRILSDIRRLN